MRKRKLSILFFIPLFLLAYLFFRSNTRYWNGEDKIATIFQLENGDTELVLVDPKLEEEVHLIIPGDTEVSVARNLGIMRLKNVWQLGVNEGLNGSLVAQTITSEFLFPVFLWRDVNGKTNVPMGDRLFLKLYNLTTKAIDKTEINLGSSQFVKRQLLSDGELGYRKVVGDGGRLTAFFHDANFDDMKIYIKDATGKYGIAEKLGKILEVLGGKVIAIEKLSKEESGCDIKGKQKEALTKVSRLFNCNIEKNVGDSDLEIRFGSDFLF